MGVVNVTPDSFSDGGLHFDRGRAVARALEMFEQGAAIVDVGGESTRPSTYGAATEVALEEELARVVPVIEGIRRASGAPVSVDTRRSAVARAALGAGADAVNDVSALRHDPAMAETVAAAGAGLVLMHMKGDDPRRMQEDTRYGHPVADVAEALLAAAARALEAGLPADRIAVDPGLGFGKSAEGNLLLLRHLAAFRALGFPVAVGASRKAFVRRFTDVGEDSPAADRLPGSLAAVAAAAAAGAAIVRVHDVAGDRAVPADGESDRDPGAGARRRGRAMIERLTGPLGVLSRTDVHVAGRRGHPRRRAHHLHAAPPDPRARAPCRWCSAS